MSGNWTWYRPTDLDETVGLLLEKGDSSLVIAGGTSICLKPPRRDGLSIIDLQALRLNEISENDHEVTIGAMVTANDLFKSETVAKVGSSMIADAASLMGPQPVRNKVTVGGNIMQTFRWCDLPGVLLALDARFVLYGPGKTRRIVSADDFFAAQPRRSLGPGEFLESVVVSKDQKGRGGAFLKLALTNVDHALVSSSVVVSLEGEICKDIRVVLGSLSVLPQRIPAAEDLLRGKSLDSQMIEEACSVAGQECSVHADKRADESYRRKVAKTLVGRAIEKALAGANAEGGASC